MKIYKTRKLGKRRNGSIVYAVVIPEQLGDLKGKKFVCMANLKGTLIYQELEQKS